MWVPAGRAAPEEQWLQHGFACTLQSNFKAALPELVAPALRTRRQPSSARAKPVSGTGLWSIISLSCSEQSHVPAFPRPAIFRLSPRCLRCFANSGRALLPDDVKLMQFSQL